MFGRALLLLAACVLLVSAVPVNVMMPLAMLDNNGNINKGQVHSWLSKLKSGGADGVMTDMWWGIVEYQPGKYNFQGYIDLANICQELGLKLQFVMSFHNCAANVGDVCNISLPPFVLKAAHQHSLFYTDENGFQDDEYLSLSADGARVFPGPGGQLRTGIQMYSDFMAAVASTFGHYIRQGIINEIEVGLGPAGELRYPAYQGAYWSYPGIGAFQFYDPGMKASFAAAAKAAGHPEWTSFPTDAGNYKDQPPSTVPFFRDGYKTPYGRFLLSWYSGTLIDHGRAVLQAADKQFGVFGSSLVVSAKVSGLHWWYKDPSHAAEVTAGYQNTNGVDAYLEIAKMLRQLNVDIIFTCLEMADTDAYCGSAPIELVEQVERAAKKVGVAFSGENALPTYTWDKYDRIVWQANNVVKSRSFTYLRLCDDLINNSGNWNTFTQFVAKMHNL